VKADRKKITIVGAGNVGATCAQRLAERDYADIILVDIVEGLAQGKALDILESAPVLGFNCQLTGASGYQPTAGSSVVIIAAGYSRKPNMNRQELLAVNGQIVSEITGNVINQSPHSIIIMVTNPVDALTFLAFQVSGWQPNRILGLSGVLDGARLSSFIAAELGVPVNGISPCVIGEHGRNMLIVPRLTTVNGVPLTELLAGEAIGRLVARTINGGAEIVGLLQMGSAFYAPSAAVARMVDAIIHDSKEVMTCATHLDGEYDIKDAVIGVPVSLGANGVERVVELELNPQEKAVLASSAAAVRQAVASANLS